MQLQCQLKNKTLALFENVLFVIIVFLKDFIQIRGDNLKSEISGISKRRTTSYHLMGNGLLEIFNQTLIKMLGTLDNYKKQD